MFKNPKFVIPRLDWGIQCCSFSKKKYGCSITSSGIDMSYWPTKENENNTGTVIPAKAGIQCRYLKSLDSGSSPE